MHVLFHLDHPQFFIMRHSLGRISNYMHALILVIFPRAGRGTVTDPFGIGPLLYRKVWFGPFGTNKSSNICGSKIFGIPNISVGCGMVWGPTEFVVGPCKLIFFFWRKLIFFFVWRKSLFEKKIDCFAAKFSNDNNYLYAKYYWLI